MIHHIPANQRHFASHGWLNTYYLFSFANYYDPENIHFGSLRVFNHDKIAGNSGFGAHSHDNMEIVTIVLRGELTHRDSMGNTGVIKAGEVQRMSAGSGITHSEVNDADEDVELYQIWLFPNLKNVEPSYTEARFADVSRKNRLLPIVSGIEASAMISMSTDATVYLSELDAGEMVEYEPRERRGAFIYVQKGSIEVNGIELGVFDQARIVDEEKLVIKASSDAEFILIDVPVM